ncbi:MAG TPA: N-acetylmuramoyl-L-alanine amidase [Luteimonas sp.]|nr:N-acetylmuramoyl-L-alanine amidase [Luteimonas sp.]
MRARGINIQQIVLGLALVAALLWNLAQASEVRALQLDAGATGTRAELKLDGAGDYKLISLSAPDRLVVDLPGAALGKGFRLPAAAGLVKAVRSGQPVPGTTRIVFELAAPVVVLKPRIEPGPKGARLVLEWPGDHTPGVLAAAVPVSAAAAGTSMPTATPAPAPEAASVDATSRLIAAMPRAGTAPLPRAPGPGATTGAPATGGAPAMADVAAAPGRSDASAQVPLPATPSPEPAVVPRAVPPVPVATTTATGVPTRIATGVPAPVAAQDPGVATPPARSGRVMQAGTRPLVIAIDAGHGGQDPGAVGPSGKREKDITLAIARELAGQVNATPGLKAHLTRDSDMFIPLNRRAQIARAGKADMFISIHADAAENRAAKGSSVYVLSLKGASSQRARWLADKENAADLIGGVRLPQTDNVLTNVLLDLTQSGHMKASEDAGNHILSGLKRIGNNHKPHIERANFAVLRTSDMPAMLVETAFLSNPDEERRLIDPEFQRTVARAVLDGVNTYFTSQPPPGTLYAARIADAEDRSAGAAGGGGP